MTPPTDPGDPLARLGPALAGVLIAVVISTLLAAVIGGITPGDYDDRATVYVILVVWILIGAFLVFMQAAAGERKALTPARILLWTVSIWIWPLLVRFRSGRK